MTDGVSEFSRPRAKVSSFGDGVEDTPRPIAPVERLSVPSPVDFDTLQLQGEEHHKGGNGDSTGERGGSDAETERAIRKARSSWRGGSSY